MAEVEAGSIKDSSKLNQNISPSSNLLDGLMFFLPVRNSQAGFIAMAIYPGC